MKNYILLIINLLILSNLNAQWTIHPITKTIVEDVYDISDYDGDGDLDYVAFGNVLNELFVYENLGNTLFSNIEHTSTIFNTPNIWAIKIQTAELNNDGLPDLVLKVNDDGIYNKIYLIQNLGNLNFQLNQLLLSSQFNDCENYFQVDDINDDGFDDIIIHKDSILTNGNHLQELISFTNDQNWGFTQNIFFTGNGYNLIYSDHDSDSDLDILFGNKWFENQNGNFITHPLQIFASGIPFDYFPNSIICADFNGDTFDDIIEFEYYSGDSLYGIITPGISNMGFSYDLIDTFIVENISNVYFDDMDGDNDLDLVSATPVLSGGIWRWHENDGSGNFLTHHIIDFQNDDGLGATWVKLFDLDQNGYNDIVVSGSSEYSVHYFPNNSGVFERPITIDVQENMITDFCLADLDDNSEIDIIQGSYENLSYSVIFNQNSIFSYQNFYLSVNNNVPYPFEYESLDFDNDSDQDIYMLAGNMMGGFYLAQIENNNGLLNIPNFIDSATRKMEYLQMVDWNFDGKMDIMYCSREDQNAPNWVYENALVVQINNGNGTFTKQVLMTDTSSIEFSYGKFAVSDLDNDGDNDFVLCDSRYVDVYWYRNDLSGFTQMLAAASFSPFVSPVSVETGKLDANNSFDLVINYAPVDPIPNLFRVYVYYNNGSGNFNSNLMVDHYYHLNPKLFDFDNDGDNDLLFSDQQDNFQWYVNDGSGIFPTTNLINTFGADMAQFGDINNDNIVDVVAKNSTGTGGGLVWYEGGSTTLGTKDLKNEEALLLVYPNPGYDLINVGFNAGIKDIEIFTIDGKLVYTNQFEFPVKIAHINANLKSGYYLIVVNSKGESKICKYLRI
ncbi:MAG: T9SS type A sorting domain-containing protein [Crocinitomicaceae bacterium]|nr:T9SS type A sorting domain-containing protein [Crocinitomicaceae bacterium]